jgi:hypothetical protein
MKVLKFATEDIRLSLKIYLNGCSVDVVKYQFDGIYQVTFEASLKPEAPSVIELRMNRTVIASEVDPETSDQRRLGLCLLGIDIVPVDQTVYRLD